MTTVLLPLNVTITHLWCGRKWFHEKNENKKNYQEEWNSAEKKQKVSNAQKVFKRVERNKNKNKQRENLSGHDSSATN